jgi:hypothetical protein
MRPHVRSRSVALSVVVASAVTGTLVGVSAIALAPLAASGSPAPGQWLLNSNAMSTAGNRQSGPQSVSDGAGGIIAVWTDQRDPVTLKDIYANHLTATGADSRRRM